MQSSSFGPTFLVGIMVGIALAYVRLTRVVSLWPIALITLALVILVGAYLMTRRHESEWEPSSSPRWNADAAPPLGQMLISYGLIAQDDLTKALDLQKQCGKRLGQVLVEMKLISHEEVARVLEEQLSRRENRLLWGRGESLVK